MKPGVFAASVPSDSRRTVALERTSEHRYEVRSIAAGYGNRWIIEFGDMLEQTMRSDYVQRALQQPSRHTPGRGQTGYSIFFELVDYRITAFTAHVQLRISLRQDGRPLFAKLHKAEGPETLARSCGAARSRCAAPFSRSALGLLTVPSSCGLCFARRTPCFSSAGRAVDMYARVVKYMPETFVYKF